MSIDTGQYQAIVGHLDKAIRDVDAQLPRLDAAIATAAQILYSNPVMAPFAADVIRRARAVAASVAASWRKLKDAIETYLRIHMGPIDLADCLEKWKEIKAEAVRVAEEIRRSGRTLPGPGWDDDAALAYGNLVPRPQGMAAWQLGLLADDVVKALADMCLAGLVYLIVLDALVATFLWCLIHEINIILAGGLGAITGPARIALLLKGAMELQELAQEQFTNRKEARALDLRTARMRFVWMTPTTRWPSPVNRSWRGHPTPGDEDPPTFF